MTRFHCWAQYSNQPKHWVFDWISTEFAILFIRTESEHKITNRCCERLVLCSDVKTKKTEWRDTRSDTAGEWWAKAHRWLGLTHFRSVVRKSYFVRKTIFLSLISGPNESHNKRPSATTIEAELLCRTNGKKELIIHSDQRLDAIELN